MNNDIPAYPLGLPDYDSLLIIHVNIFIVYNHIEAV